VGGREREVGRGGGGRGGGGGGGLFTIRNAGEDERTALVASALTVIVLVAGCGGEGIFCNILTVHEKTYLLFMTEFNKNRIRTRTEIKRMSAQDCRNF